MQAGALIAQPVRPDTECRSVKRNQGVGAARARGLTALAAVALRETLTEKWLAKRTAWRASQTTEDWKGPLATVAALPVTLTFAYRLTN